MSRRSFLAWEGLQRLGLAAALTLAAAGAGAQPLVSHLRIVVPAGPGGSSDITARVIQSILQAEGIADSSSVENIAGGNGLVGLTRFVGAERGNSAATIVVGGATVGAAIVNRSAVTLADLTPIAGLVGEAAMLEVPSSSPFRSLSDLVRIFGESRRQGPITPVPLPQGPVHRAYRLLGTVSVAAAGLLAYRMGTGGQRQLTWFNRLGTAQGTIGGPDATLSSPRVSPDGRRVVVERTAQGNTDLWLLDGTRTTRFTFDPARDYRPVWSPDGTRIVFHSNRTGLGDLYQKLASGAGSEERIVASDQPKIPSSWSADGRFVIYYSVDQQTETDLWVVPMRGERAPSVFLKTSLGEAVSAFSPDGRWVAYQQTTESGGSEIYVRPFVPPGAADTAAGVAGSQWQVSTAGGFLPVWRPDGQEVYYIDPAGAMMAAPIRVVETTLEPGAPMMLFPTRIVGGGAGARGRNYDVAPDGRFLINTELPGDAAPITLIQNWNPDAKP